MRMRTRAFIALAVIALLSIVGGAAFAYRASIRDAVFQMSKPKLPPAKTFVEAVGGPAQEHVLPPSGSGPALAGTLPAEGPGPVVVNPPVTAPLSVPKNAPAEENLAVPFTSQAPNADWSLPYQEACEEASLIMVNAYLKGAGPFTPDEADRQILALVAWENKTFGYYEDTTAEEVGRIAREYFGFPKSRAIAFSSMAEVKAELAKGNPVMLPAAGRLLENPYFRGQGPLYHMLVAKGFTADGRIITNDPGTRRGADYVYDAAVLFNAVHDWNGGDVVHGAKMMVIMEK